MSRSLKGLLEKGVGRRIAVILETFPFFMTGKITGVKPGVVVIGAQEGIPIELVGHKFNINVASLAAFWIEDDDHPIPVLDSLVHIKTGRDRDLDLHCTLDSLEDRLEDFEGKDVLFALRPRQLSILGQVFRPILVARLKKAEDDYVYLKDVNIRFTNAPDFVFPLPLYIPNSQIALFLPFDRKIQFSLT